MSETKLVVNVTAQLYWLERSHDDNELMLRKQANQKLQRIADQFNNPISELIQLTLNSND